MSFGILPNEIILEIAQNVEEGQLRQLALCSRLLNQLVTSLLYEDVEVGTDLDLSRLLRLILRKPELGTYVNTLAVTEFGGDVNREEDGDTVAESRVEQQWEVAYTVEDSDRCYTAISEICSTQEERMEWSSLVEETDWHATMALLLFQLPNLTTLYLTASNWADGTRVKFSPQWAFEHAAQCQALSDPSGPLQKIMSIDIHLWRYDGHPIPTYDVIPFFKPKSVIDMVLQCNEYMRCHTNGTDTRLETRSLSIEQSSLGVESLTGFLSCFTSVQDLHIASSERDADSRGLGAAIAHLKPCLESLSLYFHNTDGAFCSFADFEKLHTLATIPYNLLDDPEGKGAHPNLSNVFPASLTCLCLSECEWWMLETLQEFLDQLSRKEQHLPLLDEIKISFTRREFDTDTAEKLVVGFETIGIKLTIEEIW